MGALNFRGWCLDCVKTPESWQRSSVLFRGQSFVIGLRVQIEKALFVQPVHLVCRSMIQDHPPYKLIAGSEMPQQDFNRADCRTQRTWPPPPPPSAAKVALILCCTKAGEWTFWGTRAAKACGRHGPICSAAYQVTRLRKDSAL
jgi:hypothetical protein